MRILWIKSDLLFPLDKGGKLRTWHLLRHLAVRHDITYLGFASPDDAPDAVDRMNEIATRVECVPRSDPPKRSFRFYLDVARYLFDPLPYAVAKYRSRTFVQRIDSLLRDQAFDLVVSDFVLPMVNIPARLPCPLVVFTHNVESEIWRRHGETRQHRLARALFNSQYRRALRFEEQALRRADGVLAVSETDRDTLLRVYPAALREPPHVVQTGVDTSFFQPSPSSPSSRSLVFTGSMDWLANEDAMVFFCREVLPLIRRDEPGATVWIVGRSPTSRVLRLAREAGVTVTGRVDDVRPYMADAAVYVVPLRIGGGTRLKIFEAMAMGKAVVSTAVGAEGLPVEDGRHLLIADEPRTFAAAVVRLMRDAAQRRALETAARALVVDRFDWAAVTNELDEAIRRFARRRAADPAEGASRGAVDLGASPQVGNELT